MKYLGLIPIAVTIVFPLARFSEIPDLIPGNMIINGISDEPRSKFILLVLIAFVVFGQLIIHFLAHRKSRPKDVSTMGFRDESEFELALYFAKIVSFTVSVILMIVAIQLVQKSIGSPLALGEYFLPISVGLIVLIMMIYALQLAKKRKT